jgi:hypothetical protein
LFVGFSFKEFFDKLVKLKKTPCLLLGKKIRVFFFDKILSMIEQSNQVFFNQLLAKSEIKGMIVLYFLSSVAGVAVVSVGAVVAVFGSVVALSATGVVTSVAWF